MGLCLYPSSADYKLSDFEQTKLPGLSVPQFFLLVQVLW